VRDGTIAGLVLSGGGRAPQYLARPGARVELRTPSGSVRTIRTVSGGTFRVSVTPGEYVVRFCGIDQTVTVIEGSEVDVTSVCAFA
jgi:hypothetical protein